jgi:hypothetical protein
LPDGGGASNDPELLQALFNAAAGLCKVLVKQIAAALPAALKYTKGVSASISYAKAGFAAWRELVCGSLRSACRRHTVKQREAPYAGVLHSVIGLRNS